VLGEGGERILYHKDASTLPAKHHFSLHFQDGTHLTVSVQGWGAAMLLTPEQLAAHPWVPAYRMSPLEPGYTLDYFLGLWGQLKADDKAFVKEFIISKPGVWGVGNGYLQDILFRAKIHPRRRALAVTEDEKVALYHAVRDTLQQAVELGGRDTERDLYDQPGRYVKLLDTRQVGQPCVNCGAPIEKASFLGGAIYTCPQCQK
jgi:formamidopyrimidine-DNA glycosylase